MNETMTFSETATEMHAGACDYETAREIFADLAREEADAREAMDEARGNDGVSVGWDESDWLA